MAYDNTEVPAGRSQENIRELLKKYGIGQVQYTDCWPEGVSVEFARVEKNAAGVVEKVIRVRILGKPNLQKKNKPEAERRRVYRVIYWHLKAKLEVVAEGLVTFEEEFLPHIILPSGATVYDELRSHLPAVFAGTQRLALPAFGGEAK